MSLSDRIKSHLPKLITLTLVVVACLAAYLLYSRFAARPWTRDGQVRADFVQIAPRVSGYLATVAVKDNQFVKKGDLLFQIDQRPFQLAVDQAQVALDQSREDVQSLEAAVQSAEAVVTQRNAAVTSAQGKITQAEAGVQSAAAVVKESESGVVSAKAIIAQTKAQLEESRRQAERARRLADRTAGSIETAEAKASAVDALVAMLESSKAEHQQALATLDQSKAAQSEAEAALTIAQNGLIEAQAAVVAAVADRDKAKANLGVPGEENVRIRSAKVQLEKANLDLSWTSIYAPADGYITNMNLLVDTFVAEGTPFALFVDSSTFRVDGYFQETKLKNITPGDSVVVTIMGYHGQPLEGKVESIGYAISPPDLAETDGPDNLVPTIEPTFEWIRLAQRVPVRISFKDIPKDLHLVSGMTASISIRD